MQEIEGLLAQKGFWDNHEKSKAVLQERRLISGKIESLKSLYNDIEENRILLELGMEESDQETIDEVSQQIQTINEKIKKLSLDLMLSGPEDKNNAIVSINAGAGGTEAQDWAEMLFRMYSRWVADLITFACWSNDTFEVEFFFLLELNACCLTFVLRQEPHNSWRSLVVC